MSTSLIDTAPGFDQPLAVLKHCHDRIRKQLQTLERLQAHLPTHGADDEAQKAAQAVLNYFDKGAPLHHEDEEQNLIPMLLATANGEDAELLAQLVPGLIEDHSNMNGIWQDLHEQLKAISEGSATFLNPALVRDFIDAYGRHMAVEEGQVTPMAKRLFSPAQLKALGDAMQTRRGIPVADAKPSLADLRRDFGQASLSEADVHADPIEQFRKWFDEALQAEVNDANAMGLSTVDADGRPSSRIVLIKQFDHSGFTWYTNYASQKGRQLRDKPHAALLFFWSELERQVRIEGDVELTSAEDSDKYFHSRPVKSRLAALASQQSEPIADRAALERAYADVEAQYGDAPPRPPHWGGYRLKPHRIEFWQGRRSRFHDRIVYTLQDDGSWTHERLQP